MKLFKQNSPPLNKISVIDIQTIKTNQAMKFIKDIEKAIFIRMRAIKAGTQTIAESHVGLFINRLKELDLAAYEKTLKEYKELINA